MEGLQHCSLDSGLDGVILSAVLQLIHERVLQVTDVTDTFQDSYHIVLFDLILRFAVLQFAAQLVTQRYYTIRFDGVTLVLAAVHSGQGTHAKVQLFGNVRLIYEGLQKKRVIFKLNSEFFEYLCCYGRHLNSTYSSCLKPITIHVLSIAKRQIDQLLLNIAETSTLQNLNRGFDGRTSSSA